MTIDRVAAAIAVAARTVNDPELSLDAMLETLVHSARDSIPGFDLVGISTIDGRGNVHTRATTDPRVVEFDKLQYSLGEGPCLDALGAPHVVSVPPRHRRANRGGVKPPSAWPALIPSPHSGSPPWNSDPARRPEQKPLPGPPDRLLSRRPSSRPSSMAERAPDKHGNPRQPRSCGRQVPAHRCRFLIIPDRRWHPRRVER